MWYVCDVMYTALYVCVSCFVVLSRGGTYIFYIVICLALLMCTLTILSSVLCVLMVEGMSGVVNVLLSLVSVMSPPPALCNLSLRTVVKLCNLGVLTLGVSLVS